MVKKFNSTKKWQPNEKPKQTKNSINDRNCMWIVDCFRHFCFGCCFPLSVFHVFYKKYIELWRALKLNALKTKCWSKLTENIRATRYRHRTNRREREKILDFYQFAFWVPSCELALFFIHPWKCIIEKSI